MLPTASDLSHEAGKFLLWFLFELGKFLAIAWLILLGIAIVVYLIAYLTCLSPTSLWRALVFIRESYLAIESIKRLGAGVCRRWERSRQRGPRMTQQAGQRQRQEEQQTGRFNNDQLERRNADEAERARQQKIDRDEEERRRREAEVQRNEQQRLIRERINQLDRFRAWRIECQAVLDKPQIAKGIPQPDPLQCKDTDCENTERWLKMCPHELERLYAELRLDREEYKEEYRQFHPDRMSQIPEPYREEAAKMAHELFVTLQKFI